MGGTQPQGQAARSQGTRVGQTPPPRASRREHPAHTLILHSGLQACERRSFCLCFKPPSVWDFVSEALK